MGRGRDALAPIVNMDLASKIFTEKIDSISKQLDSISLYITDMNMIVSNENNYEIEDLEDLRRLVKDKKVKLFFDIECVVGNDAWRNDPLFDISYDDIRRYFEA